MGQSERPIYDMIINQGETFARTITLEEPAGTPINITSYTFKSEIRKNKTDVTAMDEFTIAIADAVNGIITMSLTANETAALESVLAFYDLIMTDTGSAVTRLLEGRVTITQRVTT